MDKYLKSKIKLGILQMFNWVPDEQMIRLQYWLKTGRKLNLENPVRYTEKLQWYKLYYRDPLMARCADKWEVRKYVEEKGCTDILNECYGVFDRPEDIPFDDLPNQFVIKATNGAGSIGIHICTDKRKQDISILRKQLTKWVKIKKGGGGREWVYDKTRPRLMVEKYLRPEAEAPLMTYKIFCFRGEPCWLYVVDEKQTERNTSLSILDTSYQITPYTYINGRAADQAVYEKPEYFREMLDIARKLSGDFPHVRVDLYNIDGKIVFGELTFFSCSGYSSFEPDEFDFTLGGSLNYRSEDKNKYCEFWR